MEYGTWAGIVIVALIFKLILISCIIYARRRRTNVYQTAPDHPVPNNRPSGAGQAYGQPMHPYMQNQAPGAIPPNYNPNSNQWQQNCPPAKGTVLPPGYK